MSRWYCLDVVGWLATTGSGEHVRLGWDVLDELGAAEADEGVASRPDDLAELVLADGDMLDDLDELALPGQDGVGEPELPDWAAKRVQVFRLPEQRCRRAVPKSLQREQVS